VGALAAWLGVLALAVVLAWRQYDDAKSQAEHDLRNRAIVAGTVFETYFAGRIGTLQAMAAAPSVRSRDVSKMRAYFARAQPPGGDAFTGGIGWLDRQGYPRASNTRLTTPLPSYADRSYFKQVIATGRPFVSQALVTRRKPLRRVIVMAVPTRDPRGKISGVLTGGLLLQPAADNPRTTDLGYAGLEIVDRNGQQLTLQSLARPQNSRLVRTLRQRKQGVLSDAHGLDGAPGHVVAFATSKSPGWTIVIDRPAGSVFASARRSLAIELGAIGAAAILFLVVIAWAGRSSRRQLRDERSRISAWAVLTRSLSAATSFDEVRQAVARALVAQFPASMVLVSLRQGGGDQATSAVAGMLSPFSTSTSTADRAALIADRLSTTAGIALDDRDSVDAELPEANGWLHPAPGSAYAERLAVGGRTQGSLTVLLPLERALGDDDRAVIRAHADQASEALTRIAQHQIEHETATVLQRSLLPEQLPVVDGVDVAACYRAAGTDVEVGGDWYDVVRRADGIVHLTVGDVAGHGIPAATLMGQLRTAFSAYAFDYTSPSEIVRRVARHVQGPHMVTMVCVTFDPLTRELAYASAGHPPPLVIDEESRAVTRLDGRGRPPLGWDSPTEVADRNVRIPAPATLVLYTDGLVERRGQVIDDGIDRLGALLASDEHDALTAAADHVVGALLGQDAEDDAALLLARLLSTPADVRLELPAEAPLLAELRRRLRSWLSCREIDDEMSGDVVLAVSEACNNAIEHAYGDEQGVVTVDLHHDGSEISITVEDHGEWRESRSDSTRGRGLGIIERLMPATTIERDARGTRVVLRRSLA